MSKTTDKAADTLFVRQNIEHDWCLWNQHKQLVAVFHGINSKQQALKSAKSVNLHAALEAVAAAAGKLSIAQQQDNEIASVRTHGAALARLFELNQAIESLAKLKAENQV